VSFTTPIPIPLTSGLDGSKDPALGTQAFVTAENVDYSKPGVVRGRPGIAASETFDMLADPVTYGTGAFAALGRTPRGLISLRDQNGERAALVTDGRLFSHETDHWTDRGPVHCGVVSRGVNYIGSLTNRVASAPDFAPIAVDTSGGVVYWDIALYNASGTMDRVERVSTGAAFNVVPFGGSARLNTTTAMLGVGAGGALHMFHRTDGGSVLRTAIAADARTPTDVGDAPVICADYDATHFYVVYMTTTVDVWKALRVTSTGTVTHTYTSPVVAGLAGLWCANTTTAFNHLGVTFTHAGGVTARMLNMATLVDLATDATHNPGTSGLDVVCGWEGTARLWWAFRVAAGVGDGDISVGHYAAATMMEWKRFYGDNTGVGAAGITWGLAHQPIRVNNRMLLTLVACVGGNDTGTWLTIDLTDVLSRLPLGLVARGPTGGTHPWRAPSAATLTTDLTAFTFATLDWSRFETTRAAGTTGVNLQAGINRVGFMGARATMFGRGTVISGSVPHYVAGGRCAELGFPFLAGSPGISGNGTAGGAVPLSPVGNPYLITACWRWTDEAGQIHRSAPATPAEVDIVGGTNTLVCYITDPWLTSKAYGEVQLELYTTAVVNVGGTDVMTTTLKLQKVVSPTFTDGYTTISLNTAPVDDSEPLYTTGNVFANVHVPADGGVAALGRRLWTAGESAVYCSKLLETGIGPSFNDEGQLQVNLPAGAGRVVALEGMDDKLLIFCERGIYAIQDGGPLNNGEGPDFSPPFRVAELGCAGPRATALTEEGVAFCAPLSEVDPGMGGPWVITRGLQAQYLGQAPRDFLLAIDDYVPDLAYSRERQQLFQSYSLVAGRGVLVYDGRAGRWASWAVPDDLGELRSLTTVRGVLWSLQDNPASWTRVDGSDEEVGPYEMRLKTSHILTSSSPVGWGRCRAVSVLGTEDSGDHTLTFFATLDQARTYGPAIFNMAFASGTSWPATGRQAPEWRLPSQKCSSIQVELRATPAVAEWAAIVLHVVPKQGRSPAKDRI
jgi:hypothetical protein